MRVCITRPKRNTKRYKEKKAWRSVFGKTSFPVFFAVGIITPYSLGILIWNFNETFLIVCIELWLRFVPQTRSTKFAMNYLYIIVVTERNVRFCVKQFNHFLTKYSSVWVEICRVSSQILLGFFHKISTRIFFLKCSRNFLNSKELLFPYLRNFAQVFVILLWIHITLINFENNYTSTFICRLFPIKEARLKRKHRKRYKEKKNHDVLFSEKQVFQFFLL